MKGNKKGPNAGSVACSGKFEKIAEFFQFNIMWYRFSKCTECS